MATNKKPEYWDGHEYVREHGRKGRYRLLEILRNQWKEDYFKDKPFVVRVCGENYAHYATIEEAWDCLIAVGESDYLEQGRA